MYQANRVQSVSIWALKQGIMKFQWYSNLWIMEWNDVHKVPNLPSQFRTKTEELHTCQFLPWHRNLKWHVQEFQNVWRHDTNLFFTAALLHWWNNCHWMYERIADQWTLRNWHPAWKRSYTSKGSVLQLLCYFIFIFSFGYVDERHSYFSQREATEGHTKTTIC
jgi:hypothetical protein